MAMMNTRRSPRPASKAVLTRAAKVTKPAAKPIPTGTLSPAKALTKAAKLQAASQKLAAKQRWEAWLTSNALPAEHALLTHDPPRADCVTQTECLKRYGLKPAELGSLAYADAGKVVFGHPTKLFVRKEVEELARRKAGILVGEAAADLLVKGALGAGGQEVGKVGASVERVVRIVVGDGPASRTRALTKANGGSLEGGI
jgi:hypothetical protein